MYSSLYTFLYHRDAINTATNAVFSGLNQNIRVPHYIGNFFYFKKKKFLNIIYFAYLLLLVYSRFSSIIAIYQRFFLLFFTFFFSTSLQFKSGLLNWQDSSFLKTNFASTLRTNSLHLLKVYGDTTHPVFFNTYYSSFYKTGLLFKLLFGILSSEFENHTSTHFTIFNFFSFFKRCVRMLIPAFSRIFYAINLLEFDDNNMYFQLYARKIVFALFTKIQDIFLQFDGTTTLQPNLKHKFIDKAVIPVSINFTTRLRKNFLASTTKRPGEISAASRIFFMHVYVEHLFALLHKRSYFSAMQGISYRKSTYTVSLLSRTVNLSDITKFFIRRLYFRRARTVYKNTFLSGKITLGNLNEFEHPDYLHKIVERIRIPAEEQVYSQLFLLDYVLGSVFSLTREQLLRYYKSIQKQLRTTDLVYFFYYLFKRYDFVLHYFFPNFSIAFLRNLLLGGVLSINGRCITSDSIHLQAFCFLEIKTFRVHERTFLENILIRTSQPLQIAAHLYTELYILLFFILYTTRRIILRMSAKLLLYKALYTTFITYLSVTTRIYPLYFIKFRKSISSSVNAVVKKKVLAAFIFGERNINVNIRYKKQQRIFIKKKLSTPSMSKQKNVSNVYTSLCRRIYVFTGIRIYLSKYTPIERQILFKLSSLLRIFTKQTYTITPQIINKLTFLKTVSATSKIKLIVDRILFLFKQLYSTRVHTHISRVDRRTGLRHLCSLLYKQRLTQPHRMHVVQYAYLYYLRLHVSIYLYYFKKVCTITYIYVEQRMPLTHIAVYCARIYLFTALVCRNLFLLYESCIPVLQNIIRETNQLAEQRLITLFNIFKMYIIFFFFTYLFASTVVLILRDLFYTLFNTNRIFIFFQLPITANWLCHPSILFKRFVQAAQPVKRSFAHSTYVRNDHMLPTRNSTIFDTYF